MESAINKTGKTAATPSRRIALLLSGGVDSAVVLHLLCEQGIKPDCFYIKIGPEDTPEENWDCTSEEDLEMATALCHRYGCRLEVVDCHRDTGIKLQHTPCRKFVLASLRTLTSCATV